MDPSQKKHHPILKNYFHIAEGIAKTFGNSCEVVIHDFSDLSSSIIAIYNGHVTERRIGSPFTDYGLATLKQGFKEDLILNYLNTSIKGKKVKSSSILIRDNDGEVIGSLCINIDLTMLSTARTIINELMNVNDQTERESFPSSVADLENRLINQAIEKIGKPIELMNKSERIDFIHLLDEMGLFLIKGGVNKVANMMDVSKYTIYNYLEKKKNE